MIRLMLVAVAFAIPLAGCSEAAHQPTPAATGDAMMAMPMPDGAMASMADVPLYPGAKMIDMKIMPHLADDMMDYNFDAPADPATVRDWFAAELGKKGYAVEPAGDSLIGSDPAGKPFRVDLRPGAQGHTIGTIAKG